MRINLLAIVIQLGLEFACLAGFLAFLLLDAFLSSEAALDDAEAHHVLVLGQVAGSLELHRIEVRHPEAASPRARGGLGSHD
jgi:hypothetical protein